MARISRPTVDDLEEESMVALHDYFTDIDPSDQKLTKARVAQATFGAIQKRRQTEGARDALRWMVVRDNGTEEERRSLLGTLVPQLETSE